MTPEQEKTLARLEAGTHVLVPNWSLIETLDPEVGREFLLYYPPDDGDDEFYEVGVWNPPCLPNDVRWMINGVQPTHWMPRPTPPQEST